MNSGQKVMIFEATKVTPVVLSAQSASKAPRNPQSGCSQYSDIYIRYQFFLDSYMVFYIRAFLDFLTSLSYQFLFACLLLRHNSPRILRPFMLRQLLLQLIVFSLTKNVNKLLKIPMVISIKPVAYKISTFSIYFKCVQNSAIEI